MSDLKLTSENVFHIVISALGSFGIFYGSQLVTNLDKLTDSVNRLNTTTEITVNTLQRHEMDIKELQTLVKTHWTKTEQVEFATQTEARIKRLWDFVESTSGKTGYRGTNSK